MLVWPLNLAIFYIFLAFINSANILTPKPVICKLVVA